MRIASEVLVPKNDNGSVEFRLMRYASPDAPHLVETRFLTKESDFFDEQQERESLDNGASWSEWKDLPKRLYYIGNNEILIHERTPVYNPVHHHYVACIMERTFVDGHEAAYRKSDYEDIQGFKDHCYIVTTGTQRQELSRRLIRYESGSEFDPQDPFSADYLEHNWAYYGGVTVLDDGDIVIPLGVPVEYCCEVLGLDVQEVFPSCPKVQKGLLVARGRWNEETLCYDLTFSRPLVISDLESSRGVDEPAIAQLKNNRLLVVIRTANVRYEPNHPRINPYAPGVKHYAYSDDGGKTFTHAMPWFFDTREYAYSSTSIHEFIRSSKTGKLYWIGNITDPQNTYGGYPRWPLVICEVDDEYGVLKKDTLDIIDTRHPGESDKVQLSNFDVFENRYTGNIEIRVPHAGAISEAERFRGDTIRYIIDLTI